MVNQSIYSSSTTNVRNLKVGILGAADTTPQKSKAILNPASCCTVTALASRSDEKGEEYIQAFQAKTGHEIVVTRGISGYQELLKSTDVEAVYIPIEASMHKEWVIKALEAGKHVMVEKPVAMCYEDYIEMRSAALKNGRYLQDASMFIYFPRLDGFVSCIKDRKSFGGIERINAIYTLSIDSDSDFTVQRIRRSLKGNPFGCIGDLGWYCLRVGIVLFCKYEGLSVQSAQVVDHKLNDHGVPVDATCIVRFDEGRSLNFHCSFDLGNRQRVEVIGERCCASMNDFFVPRHGINSYQVRERKELSGKEGFERIETKDYVSGMSPDLIMWRHFARLSFGIDTAVAKAKEKSTTHEENTMGWGKDPVSHEAYEISLISLETQRVADALLQSIKQNGLVIPLLPSDPQLLIRGGFLAEPQDSP